jgi:hypothetical protein
MGTADAAVTVQQDAPPGRDVVVARGFGFPLP